MAFQGAISGARMVHGFLAYLIECTAIIDHHEAAPRFSRSRVRVDFKPSTTKYPSPDSLCFVPQPLSRQI